MNRIRRLPPLFWIGLLPVVVLLWAWADSLSHTTIWGHCREGKEDHYAMLEEASVRFVHRREEGVRSSRMPLFQETGALGRFQRERLAPTKATTVPAPWFPLPGDHTKRSKIFADLDSNLFIVSRERSLPLWLILAGYLPLWLGVAWWQARRRRWKIEAEVELPRT